MDGTSFYRDIQPGIRTVAGIFFLLQKHRFYRNVLPDRHFHWNTFKAGLPYTLKPVIIICFLGAATGTPNNNTYTNWTVLAVLDLRSPFPNTALPATMVVSELIGLPPYVGVKSLDLTFNDRNIAYCLIDDYTGRGTCNDSKSILVYTSGNICTLYASTIK